MKKTGITIIAIILILGCTAQKAENNFLKGIEAAQQGQYDKAIAFYSKAVQYNPLLAKAWYNMALAKSALEHLDDAVHDYSKAIEINPLMTRAYLNRGIDQKALGKMQAAIADYSKAIEIDNSYALAWYNRGVAYYDARDFIHACTNFQSSVSLDSFSTDAWYNLGLTYNKLHQDKKAAFCFNKVAQLDPGNWKARAVCSIFSSDYKSAVADLRKAIGLDNNDKEAQNMLGLLLHKLDKNDTSSISDGATHGMPALEMLTQVLATAGETP